MSSYYYRVATLFEILKRVNITRVCMCVTPVSWVVAMGGGGHASFHKVSRIFIIKIFAKF